MEAEEHSGLQKWEPHISQLLVTIKDERLHYGYD
jgi:hypothetical protein